MHNRANVEWTLPATGTIAWDEARQAVLMDIREALRPLRRLDCHEFVEIPQLLRQLAPKRLTKAEQREEHRLRHRRARRAARGRKR